MTTISDPARELFISRTFAAPRDLVLQMWSEPGKIGQWWGPYGFTTTTENMDFRSGGSWKFVMHGPDGTDYPNLIKYESVGPDGINYKHIAPGGELHFEAFVTLEAVDDHSTKMDFLMVFPNAEERELCCEKYGARQGQAETTARLGDLLADMVKPTPFKLKITAPNDLEIIMTRAVRAPRTLVWEMFTKAEYLAQWQGPRDIECAEYVFDARPGGKYHFTHRSKEGAEFKFWGDVIALDEPRSMEMSFYFEGFPDFVQRSITTFDEVDGITTIRTVALYANKEGRDGMLNSGMEGGMSEGYDRLQELMDGLK